MAQNIIPFPTDRVKAAPAAFGIKRPLTTPQDIADNKRRYAARLKEGFAPDSLRMFVWAGLISKIEAEWAEYEAACQAANGGNVIEMRRA